MIHPKQGGQAADRPPAPTPCAQLPTGTYQGIAPDRQNSPYLTPNIRFPFDPVCCTNCHAIWSPSGVPGWRCWDCSQPTSCPECGGPPWCADCDIATPEPIAPSVVDLDALAVTA